MKFISLILYTSLLGFFILSCATEEKTEEGLFTLEELKSYIQVKDTVLKSEYVSHFAKNNFSEGNIIIIGAVTAIYYDVINAQRGTIEVFEKIFGVDVPKEINVFSSEIGFLEACDGEQLFIINFFAGKNNAKIITNFKLEPANRAKQIETVKEILKIEEEPDFEKRKEIFKKRCIEGLNDGNSWVANVWATQLVMFCRDYPNSFNISDLQNLMSLEVHFLEKKTYATTVIQSLKASIVLLIKLKFKKYWVEKIIYGSPDEKHTAVNQLSSTFVTSYEKAYDFHDRIVLQSLKEIETDARTLLLLADAVSKLRVLLPEPRKP